MTKQDMEGTVPGMIITYGKYEGTLFTRLPLSYLHWMVREDARMSGWAKDEINRRSSCS